MEDRFKFRAWDIEKKEMTYFHNKRGMQYNNDEIRISNGWDGNDNPKYWGGYYEEYVDRTDKYILMQCTGLKDKNGKLIYEEDIVKVPTQCNKELHGSYSLQEIVWRNGNWVLSYISSEKGRKLPRGWSACFLHDQWSDEYEKEFIFTNADIFCTYNALEIIGNIHENKELLEEQK